MFNFHVYVINDNAEILERIEGLETILGEILDRMPDKTSQAQVDAAASTLKGQTDGLEEDVDDNQPK